MKIRNGAWIWLVMVIFLLAGCTATQPQETGGKLKVYASFYPMYDFTQKIGGDRIALSMLVPAGIEPHDWEPSPAEIAGISDAGALIYNGADMEHWVEAVAQALGEDGPVFVETAKDLPLLEGDPHVWLSPQNAKEQMRVICDALSELDPEGKNYYEENFARRASELDALDKEYRDTLSALPRREIVVAHECFGYLCRDYGLTQVAARGFSPDGEPDPATMAEVAAFCKEHDIKVIFFESLASPKIAETIARETGASVDVLNPLEGLEAEHQQAGDDYFSVMRKNLSALKNALE